MIITLIKCLILVITFQSNHCRNYRLIVLRGKTCQPTREVRGCVRWVEGTGNGKSKSYPSTRPLSIW